MAINEINDDQIRIVRGMPILLSLIDSVTLPDVLTADALKALFLIATFELPPPILP